MVKGKNKSNTKLWVIAAVLGLLIIIAGVQTVQLTSLKSKLNSESTTLSVNTGSSKVSTNSDSNSDKLASNLNNLPTMVGGC